MGLDMHLIKRKIEGKNWDDAVEIGYWRKANAIHRWFDEHNPGGLENCEDMVVTKSMLLELKKDCEIVLKGSKIVKGDVWNGQTLKNGKWVDNYVQGDVIEDSSLAEELLPTKSGFFFGSKQYGQWYINDLERTIEIVDHAIDVTDFNEEELCYFADW